MEINEATIADEVSVKEVSKNNNETYEQAFSRTNFSELEKIILRNLNENPASPVFNKYSKAEILTYLKDPYRYEDNLREAVIYIYGVSSIYWRIVQYFASLTDFAYVISPENLDITKAKKETLNKNRLKTIALFESMNLETQLREILTVCFREDVYYATTWLDNEKITIQQLPSKYCRVASIEDNVLNVTFDFSYFSGRNEALLEYYPPEFEKKYRIYQKERRAQRWQDLDSPASFAIKVNRDIKNYAMPPLVGTLISLYDLADYQDLLLSKTELENYALLFMKLGMTTDGQYEIPYQQAVRYFDNLASQLPEQVGAVLTPMKIEKIDFKDDGADASAAVANAENSIFTAAGVSSLLFNNPRASAAALLLSIKADQAITFAVVQSIEDALNRILKYYGFGRNFKIKFLDVSRFNRDEMADQYLKAATYGMPTISMYCAAVGLNPTEVEGLNYLENDVLNLTERFKPLRSSNTMSSSDSVTRNRVGRPRLSDDDLSDEGENSRERE